MSQKHYAPHYKKELLLLLVFIVICVVFLKFLTFKRQFFKPSQSSHALVDNYFFVLGFPSISNKETTESMSEENFTQIIQTLKNNGFIPITMNQAQRFLYNHQPLPPKSVLLVFTGFSEGFNIVDHAVHKYNLRATMLLDVENMKITNYRFLSWHNLDLIKNDRHYDLGILVRSAEDVLENKSFFEKELKVKKPFYLSYSFSDDHGFLKSVFSLAFLHRNSDGYNRVDTPPLALNMRLIPPSWTADDFIYVLQTTAAQRNDYQSYFENSSDILDWFTNWGHIAVEEGKLKIFSAQGRRGAEALLLGTQNWHDVSIDVQYELDEGDQFWVYARQYNSDNYIRLGQDGKNLYVQQRNGAEINSLRGRSIAGYQLQSPKLRFIIRDHYAIAYLNGQRMFEQPLDLQRTTTYGRVGFSIWNSAGSSARAKIDQVEIKQLPHVWLNCSDRDQCLKLLKGSAEYISILSPQWFRTSASSDINDQLWDYDLMLMFSGYYRMQLMPTLKFREEDMSSLKPSNFVEEIKKLKQAYSLIGLSFDITAISKRNLKMIKQVVQALKDTNLQLNIILNEEQWSQAADIIDDFYRVGLRLTDQSFTDMNQMSSNNVSLSRPLDSCQEKLITDDKEKTLSLGVICEN